MRCPWCDFEGPLRPLHAHLAVSHPEQVRFEDRSGGDRQVYAVACPICGAGYEQTIKPRHAPDFVDEYRREIRLVAFDMLLNHLVGEHEPHAGAGPNPPES
ncbi:hypothetical protein GHK86_03565 [Acidimicrobiaceae bacterium USS-CC1]|uniref:YgiT-type zinc finger protein n=1 Tax=Acidiferrimicrobium australe TaxID=2664430 RepID=A0ABW9QQA1_9ACTN|nr:hypothetical protein [Acidiferrimicrobium australe]